MTGVNGVKPTDKVDVLVVGAGPTGLTLACELLRRGVSCRVVEQRESATPMSRAMGVQRRTLEIFGAMDVIDAVVPELALERAANNPAPTKTLGAMFVVNGRPFLRWPNAPANPQRVGVGFSGRWLPQSDLEQALQRRLEALGGRVELNRGLTAIREDGQEMVATAGGEEYRADWIIGCDGGRSVARKLLGFPFTGSVHASALLLADVEIAWNKEAAPAWVTREDRAMNVFIGPEGAFLVMRLPRMRGWRLIAIVAVPDRQAPVPEPTVELMNRLLKERTGEQDVHIGSVTWMSSWRLSERMVPAYRKGRVFLAGDAAHIHSPIGGQGLNTGVQDAYNLAWKLAYVVKGLAGHALLSTYEEERLPIARRVLRMTRWLTKPFEPAHHLVTVARSGALAQVFRVPAARAWTQLQLSQLKVNYRNSSLSSSEGTFTRQAPAAGDRAPDALCTAYPSLAPTNLFEATRGTTWNLLVFQGDTGDRAKLETLRDVAVEAAEAFGSELRPHIVVKSQQEADQVGWTGSVLIDRNKEAHTTYGALKPSMFLIRPDGYVGLRSSTLSAAGVARYLGRVFDIQSARTRLRPTAKNQG